MAREFYLYDIRLWPPPWNTGSPLRRALSCLWFLLLLPVIVITTVIGILLSVVSALSSRKTSIIRSPAEVVQFIDDFVNGTGQSDFGQFLYVTIEDPQLDSVRIRCLQLHEEYPPEEEGYWCSRAGMLGIGGGSHHLILPSTVRVAQNEMRHLIPLL